MRFRLCKVSKECAISIFVLLVGYAGDHFGHPHPSNIHILSILIMKKFVVRLLLAVIPFTGRMYKAQEAYDAGILNYLVTEKDLTRFSIRLGKLVSGMSPDSLLAVKQSVYECVNEMPANWGESKPFVSKKDFSEGVLAFVEKRQPNFKR